MEIAELIRKAKRVYLCGNGGSAANAIHIANDLISVGVRAHALTADIATLTAIANDFSYKEVFSRQLKVFGEAGSVLIALSGSGNSDNILLALVEAKLVGLSTVAVVGNYGGPAAVLLADHVLRMGENMQAAEEAQLVFGHELMHALKEKA